MSNRIGLVCLAFLVGCSQPVPPPSESDVLQSVLNARFLQADRFALVATASDCRTMGTSRVPVVADLFGAYLNANTRGAEPFDLSELSTDEKLISRRVSPERYYRQHNERVVAISRAGIWEDSALVCVEIFGSRSRGFFIQLNRISEKNWEVEKQYEVWDEPVDD